MLKKTQIARGIMAVRNEAASPGEVKQLIESLNKAFADFKVENDTQLANIKKGQEDALQSLKVDRINNEITNLQTAVDAVNAKIAAQELEIGGVRVRDAAYNKAFIGNMRTGAIQNDLSRGSAPDGGYLAPVEWDRTITDKLIDLSPMRSLATVQRISGAGYTKLFNMGGTGSGWVGETAARPTTGTPQLMPLTFNTGEIYANPAATQTILDDAEIDLEQWLADEVKQEFALQEGVAFLTGDGVNKPTGILTYVTGQANAAKHPFGAIEAVTTAAAGIVSGDDILDLIYDLPSAFTQGASFAMNRRSMAAVRKLKDNDGNYMWQTSMVAGQPSTLMGFPLRELGDAPDIATGAIAALFGNFKQTYIVIDRIGVRVLRDPYTNKPYVNFYTTKRVGGGVFNPQPMRALVVL